MRGKVRLPYTALLRLGGGPRPIPFVSTPFSFDLMLFLALWPLWWMLGVEQILPPLFVAWETARYLWRARGRFTLGAPVVWAGLLALWWLVPALWVNREYVDIFVKETSTAWSQVLMLFLFWNTVRTAREWDHAARGLTLMAACLVLGAGLFFVGIGREPITSALGILVPRLADTSSAFFRSIVVRRLGELGGDSEVLPFRLRSLALQPTYLSMASLLLIPHIAWRMHEAKGRVRAALGVVFAGLLVCLAGTESRVAYLALGVGLLALAVYASRSWRGPVRAGVFAGVAILLVVAVVVASGGLGGLWRRVVVEWRPGSLLVRSRVYEETLRLLPEHPIAGWGVQMRIPGKPASFSAGSHSSIFGMWFRHGVVGLALYIGLWVSIWREVIRGLKGAMGPGATRWFWVAAALSLLCFNIRELVDVWWWDQTVAMTLWTVWGLALAAPVAFAGSGADSQPIAEQEQGT